ncbi:MAG: winged helix-turn-helix transcriptional regulator [Rhizobiales bacterium]|nr:winged helix-turn-helix transcriptional regulator [Hyphomicrobiales bacterium]
MADKQPRIDHSRYIPALLLFVANKLASGASNTYRRQFGVGVTEWRILSLLANEPDCSAQRICEFFDLDKALVSRTLQVLAKSQIVSIHVDAYRRRTINLTRKGLALHNRIIKVALSREERLLTGFTSSETDKLAEFLGRLLIQVTTLNSQDLKLRMDARRPAGKTSRKRASGAPVKKRPFEKLSAAKRPA